MDVDLKAGIVRILKPDSTTVGTGFVISDGGLIATCAHVVQYAGAEPGATVRVAFHATKEDREARVEPEWWRAPNAEDVAILRLQGELPPGVEPVILGRSENAAGHFFRARGYAKVGDMQGVWAEGKILGLVTDSQGTTMLQLRTQEVMEGMSGAPVLDIDDDHVVGIITATYYPANETPKFRDAAFAIPTEVAAEIFPLLQLTPPSPSTTASQRVSHAEGSYVEGSVDIGGDFVGRDKYVYHYQHSPASVPFQAPPLPAHYIPRLEVTNVLKARLLADEPATPGILVISAIHGLGGIGKSTVAAALAHDSQVKNRFRDGILWATLGQQPDLLSLLSTWVQEFGDYDFRPTRVEAVSAHLQTLLRDKAVLLVVDDVWDSVHAMPFRIGGARCQVLVTTRRADVADQLGAELHELDVMTQEQSLDLLATRLGRLLDATELKQAPRLAHAVGYLPLALELAAVRVARGTSWTLLCDALEEEIARLEALEDPRHRRGGQTRLEATFNLSLNALRADDQEAWRAFVWLGILPEDVQIIAPMTSILWVMDQVEATDILELLWNDALLLPGPLIRVGERRWPAYRLHDLLKDMARRLLNTAPPEGLGLDLSMAHTLLLERYRRRTKANLWHTLPDDGYIHSSLTWHMEQAGWEGEIHALLCEETADGHHGWYEARNRLGQTAGYLADVTHASELAGKAFTASTTSQTPPEVARGGKAIGIQCRYALLVASLNSLAKNIPSVLLAALVDKRIWSSTEGLTYALQRPQEELRLRALVAVAPYLSKPLMSEALATIPKVEPESLKMEMLSKLVPALPVELLREALTIARSIREPVRCAEALVALVPKLPETLLTEALAVAQRLDNEQARAIVLTGLVPRLPEPLRGNVLQAALDAARGVNGRVYRAQMLVNLLPHLPRPEHAQILQEALTAALISNNKKLRKGILVALGPYLSKELLGEALTAARHSKNREMNEDILIALGPHLPRELLGEARVIARRLESGDSLNRNPRAEALVTLALNPSAPMLHKMLPELLTAVRLSSDQDWSDESPQVELLARLGVYLLHPEQEQVFQEAWAAGHAIQGKERKALALASLAPYLPESEREEVMQESLAEARAIEDQYYRAKTLAELALELPEPQQRDVLLEALAAVQKIEDETWRAETLVRLIAHMPENLLRETIAAVRMVKDENDQVRLLAALVPNMFSGSVAHPLGSLPQESVVMAARLMWKRVPSAQILMATALRLAELGHPREALVTARVIADNRKRTDALSALASRLAKAGYLQEAFEAGWAIHDERARVVTLTRLALYWSGDSLRIVLAMALRIKDKYDRVVALSDIIPRLTDPLKSQTITEALAAVRAILDGEKRADALGRLAPYLSDLRLKEALALAQAISWCSFRAVALAGIVPHLREPVKSLTITEALAAARAIPDKAGRVATLTKLAAYLPETSLRDVVTEARTLVDKPARMIAMAKLAPHLSGSLQEDTWREVLEMAQDTKDESTRAEMLLDLVPFLPEQLKVQTIQRALAAAQTIEDETTRTRIISELVPHLTQLPRDTLFPIWYETLAILATRTRQDLLADLRVLAPAIAALGGDQAVTETFRAIQDVGRWWS